MVSGCTSACLTSRGTFLYSTEADRTRILELCVTSGVRPSNKTGGRPAGRAVFQAVNLGKVSLAYKDAMPSGQEYYLSDVPSMLLPFPGLENGVQLDSSSWMKPRRLLRDG